MKRRNRNIKKVSKKSIEEFSSKELLNELIKRIEPSKRTSMYIDIKNYKWNEDMSETRHNYSLHIYDKAIEGTVDLIISDEIKGV